MKTRLFQSLPIRHHIVEAKVKAPNSRNIPLVRLEHFCKQFSTARAMAAPRSADVLIIGGGPGGLATALGLSRQLITCIVFDSGVYRNALVQHMHNLPTWDHENPAAYRAAARKELTTRYDTTSFVEKKIETLRKKDEGGFEAVDAQGTTYNGKYLVLASGVKDVPPTIDGYDDCWGSGIFHCLFCHGFEERGAQEVGVLAEGPMLSQAQIATVIGGMARRLAQKATIFTNGNDKVSSELQDADVESRGFGVDSRPIQSFEKVAGDTSDIVVHLADGAQKKLGFMVHAPKNEMSSPWHQQLDLEVEPMGFYKTKGMFNETTVPGVFAVGDCAIMAKAVPAAISSGAMVAAGIAHQMAAAW